MDPLYHEGLTGAGKTIVLVDAYGSPTIQGDLTTFDQETNLPAPPSFKIIQPAGAVPPYDPTNYDQGGWGVETSLDVEYAMRWLPEQTFCWSRRRSTRQPACKAFRRSSRLRTT
jgi:subtilase family serine protease